MLSTPRLQLLLAFVSLASAPALGLQEAAPEQPEPTVAAREPAPEAPPTLAPLPDGIAARSGDVLVPLADLDELLLKRHGKRAEGLDVLNRLLTTTVLREVAKAEGVAISSEFLNERIAELDARMRESGLEGGLASQLEEGDVDPDLFREMLALSLAQEELTRRALSMPEGSRPSPGQQNTWMDELMASRGSEAFMDPFPSAPDAVVARAGTTEVTMAAFHERMREELPRPMIEQACTQLVLLSSLEAMAGEIAPLEWDAAVAKELEARRAKHQADPERAGVSYEALLNAQGLSLAIMAEDPAVEVTALTTVLARRRAAEAAPEDLPQVPEGAPADERADFERLVDAGLRALYAAEQDFFDGYYGERLFLRVCLQRASETPNELVPRSVEDSLGFFERLIPSIPDEEGFIAIVGEIADDPAMRQTGGELGWFAQGDERLPKNLRLLAFDHWATTGTPGVAGPVQVTGGVAILWVGDHEPAPEWEVMAEYVLREHQGRVLADATPRGGIQIYLDPPPRLTPEAPAATPDEAPTDQ